MFIDRGLLHEEARVFPHDLEMEETQMSIGQSFPRSLSELDTALRTVDPRNVNEIIDLVREVALHVLGPGAPSSASQVAALCDAANALRCQFYKRAIGALLDALHPDHAPQMSEEDAKKVRAVKLEDVTEGLVGL